MQGAGAMVSGSPERRVAVASTGVIGVSLPMREVNSGILAASHALSARRGRRLLGRDPDHRRV